MTGIKLNELPSRKLYNELNTVKRTSIHMQYCSLLPDSMRLNGNILKLCKNLAVYLINKSKESNLLEFGCSFCKLLNYWVLDELYKIYRSSYKHTENFEEFKKLWDNINESLYYNKDNKCLPEFYNFRENDWEGKKELYEYCVDYVTLFEKGNNNSKCKEYYEYIQNKDKLYNKLEEYFISEDKEKCLEFYDKCESYKPNKVLDTLSCHVQIMAEKGITVSLPLVRGGQDLSFSNMAELDEALVDSVVSYDVSPSAGDNSHIGRILGFSSFGIFFIFIISYKFTPVGSWLHSLLFRKNIIRQNIGDGMIQDLDEYSLDSEDVNMEKEKHVSYHPS
ncbi:PIR protein [Plasmodium ovale]|uniref:PIR Superfamily Protein n=2 Tax=Plasmodium ovale TaxID=36330 RepID=A0A1A8XBA9_PLAOA|nr:PIR Superfamily Protein [Plasmodium ovale curtisi]SBT01940.1 PIR Superfamily Protein [Plasmodium ovale curtisi]SBT83870.1 PIR protein [Plasmodium ovale]